MESPRERLRGQEWEQSSCPLPSAGASDELPVKSLAGPGAAMTEAGWGHSGSLLLGTDSEPPPTPHPPAPSLSTAAGGQRAAQSKGGRLAIHGG